MEAIRTRLKNTRQANIDPLNNIDRQLINQAELARRTGYSEAYISYILRGQRKNDELLEQIKNIIRETAQAA